MSSSEFYIACAQNSRREADLCTLDNVRNRCLRSAAAWDALADRAGEIEINRLRRAAGIGEAGAVGALADVGHADVRLADAGLAHHG